MNADITQERAPNVVSELLIVIRNSETRREALEKENMQLREENRRLQSRVTQLSQIQIPVTTDRQPETRIMGHNNLTNTSRRAVIRPATSAAIRPVSPL